MTVKNDVGAVSILLKEVTMLLNNPHEMTYEAIVDSGKKICIGHGTAYALHISGHYFVAYENHPVRYVWVELNVNRVHVYYADGSAVSWNNPFFDAYITQFGIAVSADGGYIFAQTWENGLYCFSSRSGEKVWKTKSRSAVKNIYVNNGTVCVNRQDKKLELLDIVTGTAVGERKIIIYEFFAVDSKRFMCRTSPKKWEVIDAATLETTDTFSADDGDSVRSWFSIFYG